MYSWEQNVRKVVPYVPGEQPKFDQMIKLNTNENPYPPAPGVEKSLSKLEFDKLRLYPDIVGEPLVSELASYYGLDKKEVFVGVGSDDVLSVAFLTFFNGKKPIFFPDITYSFYDVWADVYRIPYECQPLDESFRIKKEDYYKENGGVIFPNPNAPTGVLQSLDDIEDIIKHNQDVVVIVDEAYIDFGGVSALELIHKYDNLLVVQTFSKSRSLAGLRVGYAMGNEALIRCMNDVKYSINSYTMNYPALVYGVEAIRDEAYFKETTGKIIATRERTKVRLKELGFEFGDSMSNFIFASHKTVSAKKIFEELRSYKIFVRYFNKPRIDNYLRITIGTDEEMDALFEALEKIVK